MARRLLRRKAVEYPLRDDIFAHSYPLVLSQAAKTYVILLLDVLFLVVRLGDSESPAEVRFVLYTTQQSESQSDAKRYRRVAREIGTA